MRKLLLASLLALLPAGAYAADSTITIKDAAAANQTMSTVTNSGNSMFKGVISHPSIPTQSLAIDANGAAPVSQPTAANLNMTAAQPTAANLNATMVGALTTLAAGCQTTSTGTTIEQCVRQLHADMIAGVNPPGTLTTTGALSVQGSGASALPVLTAPSIQVPTALAVTTVTTGGTAVTAVTAGNRKYGGVIVNPANATEVLCINELTTASGTNSNGSTICIAAGNSYNLAPAAGAVSVVAATSAHAFAGLTYN